MLREMLPPIAIVALATVAWLSISAIEAKLYDAPLIDCVFKTACGTMGPR